MPGWKPLIVCGETVATECKYEHLFVLVKNLVNDMIVLSTFLFVFLLIYIAFLFLSSQGSESARTKAKDILWKVMWGYIWILGAWLVVYTITSALLKPGFTLLGN